MGAVKEILVPDIGGSTDVDVVEVCVQPGDSVELEQTLVVLEGEKATMDIPASEAGVVKEIKLQVGDKVSQGSAILSLETQAQSQAKSDSPVETSGSEASSAETQVAPTAAEGESKTQQVFVPNIGDTADVDVIEISVQVGDEVAVDDALVVLEGEKATMEVPAPFAGVIEKLHLKVGDKVSEGSLVADLRVEAAAPAPASKSDSALKSAPAPKLAQEQPKPQPASSSTIPSVPPSAGSKGVYASPSVRRIAREFGVDLTLITGTGRKGRIIKKDVQAFVKSRLAGASSAAGLDMNVAKLPEIDFSQFGEVEVQPLSKIKKLSGANLHRNWLHVPHVTQFDEADITELEAFRQSQKVAAEAQGFKLTPLVFLMKAVTHALREYPVFNSSLSKNADELIMKKYFHIGVAVDTPNGLVVPVIRDVDKKGLYALARELHEVSAKARDGKLLPADMQGSCFTISSLGGIGGTNFTPIVNMPDVAILGVSKSSMKPVYKDGEFIARLMLPIAVSYDHRVIDGAQAARFIVYLSSALADIRKILL